MGKTRGFWDPGDGTVREFDEVMKRRREGAYSRSRAILDAMEMYQRIEEVFEDAGVTPEDERMKRLFVESAVRERIERDT